MCHTNHKKTSKTVGALAARTLQDSDASAIAKRLAASALAQRNGQRQTGPELEEVAARVLASPKYSDETKTLAASVVSQANKER